MPGYASSEFNPSDLQALAAGKTGKPEDITTGGVKATGKIVLTGNILAGDTFTINGVVHTAMASGAAGAVQFNVGASLSLSLDALVTLLNASANPLVSLATYTNTDTGTALTMTLDAYGTAGNSIVIGSNHSTVVVTQPAGGKATTALSLVTEFHNVIANVNVLNYVTLADGEPFQRKFIGVTASVGTSGIVVTPDNLAGGTTLTFDAIGKYADMIFMAGEWYVIASAGTPLA